MEKNIFEKEFKALGTDIYIQIIAPGDKREDVFLSFAEVENIYRKNDLIFSRFKAESELSKMNNNLGVFRKASAELIYLAQESLKYYAKSEKIFDPRILDNLEKIGYKNDFKDNDFNVAKDVSTEIFKKELSQDLLIQGSQLKFLQKMDFSGIAKGYITDKVAKFLSDSGWQNFLVDSGGDMYAKGLNKWGEKWGIALEGSENEDEIVTEITNAGIATSGNTRKYWEAGNKKFHHLLNPRQAQQFSFDLKSVTVVAPTTQEADVWAKVLFILGPTEGFNFATKHNIKSIFLKSNKEVFTVSL